MDDKTAELLAQYDVVVYRAGRVKGAWILETDRGLLQLSGCSYSEGKVRFEQRLKEHILAQGFQTVEQFVPAKNGEFLVQGPYNEMYVMRTVLSGEECDARNEEHAVRAAAALGRLHNCMNHFSLSEEEKKFCRQTPVTELFERRNKELRRIRSYIRSKKQKSSFEQKFLAQFDAQYASAVEAATGVPAEEYLSGYQCAIEQGVMLHGNYTHHSIQFLSPEDYIVTGFEKAENGLQIHDFYLLFRKFMEKWDWDIVLGEELLRVYEKERAIPDMERTILRVLLLYPEKFWKVANQYYNNRKSWIPEKNMQKLLQTMEQAEKKADCIRALF